MATTSPAARGSAREVARALGAPATTLLVLAGCCALTLLLRAPFVTAPLGIDESGYAYVAERWGEGAGGIYGAQWVDRPPLLMALFAGAIALAGDVGVRLMGCMLAVLVVVCCGLAGRTLAGGSTRVLATSAGLAALLVSSPLLQGHMVNAELPAIAFVSCSVLLMLRSVLDVTPYPCTSALGAGLLGGCAILVKQSFVDAFAFAGPALLVAIILADRRERPDLLFRAVAFVAGGAWILGGALAWADLAGPGAIELIDALYAFRADAARIIAEQASAAPMRRARLFGILLLVTGLAVLLVAALSWCVRRGAASATAPRTRAAAVGLGSMGAFAVVAIVLGGSWWRHYLLQLVPFLAIAGGVAAHWLGSRTGVAVRRSVIVVAASIAIGWAGAVAHAVVEGRNEAPRAVGSWIAAAAEPGDTLLVAWGHADVQHASGLRTPYDTVWSLPMRVRDPQLARLRALIAGRDAPTWLVRWTPLNSWDIDADGQLRDLVRARYERVGDACGRRVYLLRGSASTRSGIGSPPTGRACGRDSSLPLVGRLTW